jgi:hypothetical protein
LLLAAFAGPLASSVQLGVALSLSRRLCEQGARWPLHAVTALALLVTLWGLVHCWSRRGAGTAPPPRGEAHLPGPDAEAPLAARRAIAWAGIGLGVFFVLLVLALGIPGLALEACQ